MRVADRVAFRDSGLDRGGALRGDPAALDRALAGGLVLPLWQGKPLMDGEGLVWLTSGHPVLEGAAAPVLLGLDPDRTARFACDLPHWVPPADAEPPQPGFSDATIQHHPALPPTQGFAELRGAMLRLSPREGELAATARAVTGWHRGNRFCAACGSPTVPDRGGWHRVCQGCAAHHFPRTDPVVIMLVTHGNRALLGRSPGWPPGMFSCLAGFVEPGETVEAAVRREVFEEAAIRVGAVRYLASQPWPFPSSLMLGCVAEALDDAITIDPLELEAALWLTREEMVEVQAGRHPALRPAREGAIAQALLRGWLADRLD